MVKQKIKKVAISWIDQILMTILLHVMKTSMTPIRKNNSHVAIAACLNEKNKSIIDPSNFPGC